MYYSKNYDVYFVEGSIPNTEILGKIHEEMRGTFSQSHLKSLDDVKKKISKYIKQKNGNALINFKYGQKSTFFGSLFSIDNIMWYGIGDIVKLNEEQIRLLEMKE
jgi:hypothetical protein